MDCRKSSKSAESPIIRRSIWRDVEVLGPRLRKSDVAELEAASGNAADHELMMSFLCSHKCWTIERHDCVIGMFGVSPKKMSASDVALAWLLGTDDLYPAAIPLLKVCRSWVDEMSRDYRVLLNFVDVRNVAALRWVQWTGFRIVRLHDNYGVNGEAFWEIRSERRINATDFSPTPTHANSADSRRNPNRLLFRHLAKEIAGHCLTSRGTVRIRFIDAPKRTFYIDLNDEGITFCMGDLPNPDSSIDIHIDNYSRWIRHLASNDFTNSDILNDLRLEGDSALLSIIAQAMLPTSQALNDFMRG